MPRRSSLSTLQEISEINMTPLMDLTFILLITFIITFPLIEQGIPVQLPQADAEPVDARESRSVTLDGEGRLYLDETSIDRSALRGEMAELAAADPDITVYVRADQALAYRRVVEVMTLLREAGIVRVALVTEAEGGS